MNYTTYFKNINLQSVLTVINDCNSQIDIARAIDIKSVLGDNIWMSNAKNTFVSYLDRNDEEIENLKSSFELVIDILSETQKVKDLEVEMDSSYDPELLMKNANEISRLITDITQKALSIKTPDTSKVDTSSSNVNMSEYRIDYNSLNSFISGASGSNNISTYMNSLNSGYSKFNSLQSQVSTDQYLYYIWYKVVIQYDEIIKRCDSLTNWLLNYLNAVKAYEEAMPESVPSVVNNITKVSNYKDHSSIKVSLPSLTTSSNDNKTESKEDKDNK